MSKRENLTGLQFDRLTVQHYSHSQNGQSMWVCACNCGSTKIVSAGHLKSGHTKSCGCFNKEQVRKALATHGQTNTRLHNIWFCMKQRCYNPNHSEYKNYGGRGIKICDNWLSSFQSFYEWATLNGYEDSLSIDRLDVNGAYSPENCRWATSSEQSQNTRACHYITYNNTTLPIREWERRLGMNRGTISARINKLHWTTEKALTTPANHKNI